MTNRFSEIFRSHFRPMEPIPTDQRPVLAGLSGVRAVLFDLYGTLFVSGSGEVGTSREAACQSALAEALSAVGIAFRGEAGQAMECFFQTIEAFHAESRSNGIDYPEVQIVEVWREVLAELAGRGMVHGSALQEPDLERLAVEYEARANPVWPMPGLVECLEELRRKRLLLGIVSNAQFYARDLFPALLGELPEAFGFDVGLQYYSYQHGWGKPSLRLFEIAAAALRDRRIEPVETLYVGNDMLNDVFPAYRVGFRTALFAGDRRSLRLRRDDPRVAEISPELILTRLGQLRECII